MVMQHSKHRISTSFVDLFSFPTYNSRKETYKGRKRKK